MLSRMLLIAWAVELALYALLIGLGIISLLSAVLIYFGLRAVVIGYMFYITERHRSPRPPEAQLGLLGWARLLLAEYLALVLLYGVLQPFERWLTRPGAHDVAGGIPVLFIHGYFCNGGAFALMRRYLARHGFTNTSMITCEPVYGDIDDYAGQVHARIEEICAATGAAQVVLVGHSMGGLTARRYVQLHGPARVAKIITLGTPHHGAIHSHGGRGRNARQMRLDSRWLERLNADETGPAPVPIASVFSYHDNIVAPQESARLGHAATVALHGVGHLEMVFSPRVLKRVLEEIQSVSQA